MRCITYAGAAVITTDDVADALITLAVALANHGRAEVVEIPIFVKAALRPQLASLVIGVGTDLLAFHQEWVMEKPDFSDHAGRLRVRVQTLSQPSTPSPATDIDDEIQRISDYGDYVT